MILTNEYNFSYYEITTRLYKCMVFRLGLLVKLFFVMGISWLFEAISGTVNMRENKVLETIERILDSVNCLQGEIRANIIIISSDNACFRALDIYHIRLQASFFSQL